MLEDVPPNVLLSAGMLNMLNVYRERERVGWSNYHIQHINIPAEKNVFGWSAFTMTQRIQPFCRFEPFLGTKGLKLQKC